MGVVMLQVLFLVLNLCAFASSLVVPGSAAPPVLISIAPSPVPQPNGTNLQPPLIIPPASSAAAPSGLPSSSWPSNHSTSPPNLLSPPPGNVQDFVPSFPPIPPPENSEHPPVTVQAPAPALTPSRSSPPNEQAHTTPPSMPANSNQAKAPASSAPLSASAPVSNVPAPPRMPLPPPPSHSFGGMPESPPSLPPDVSASPPLTRNSPPVKPILNDPPPSPSVSGTPPPSLPPDVSASPPLTINSPPVKPILNEPPSSPPEHNVAPMFTPPPSISPTKHAKPIAAPINTTIHHNAPVSHSPTQAPAASNPFEHSSNAPPPHPFSKSSHHNKVYKTTPPPAPHGIPPTSGSSASPSSDYHFPPISAPPPASPSGQANIPNISPKISPSGPSRRSPKTPLLPPVHALPPPPPHKGCAPLTCTEPLTYGPPESPCICVLPIQVGLRLTVALYTFFPLVSELAAEIAAGVFMKQSEVRIMGANAAGDDPEKTIVLIDLLPLGEKFDGTTAYLTFQRFWKKQVAIKTSFFGSYDVLYVRYPGLPPSPPLPPSTIGIIASKPFPGNDNNARNMKPLGVDITREQQKHGLNRSVLATIIVSSFVALILLCAVAWLFLFRHKHRPDPTPPPTLHSLAKSSGRAVSTLGSGPSSPSFSLGSSIAAYTGSAKTFSSSDIERATDFFNETRILGEGGFGIVYCGILEDGTKVAMKILKRYDQQGGREFLAEVEMLSRLHHRNLVKLIGICAEDRTRCLVYELIPNGSVESHLHGIDKERSPLDWSARLKIALGAARALAYLHEDSSPHVIHRDFKASNILLEDDFTPKVSDFGLARAALDEGNRHISTRVMGTFGYVAPEYAMTGHLLVKSDVYSYGVVLLELLTGRKPVDMSQPPGQENLVSWARPLLTTPQGLETVIDQSLGPDFPLDNIAKVAAIASMCVQPEVSHRPFMGEVVQALKLVWDETRESSTVMDVGNSTTSANLLSPSTVSDYDYRVDVERDFSMSELLGSAVGFGNEDRDESFRRYSSSGPLRTAGKAKPLWKTMRRLSGGSLSEHGMMFKLWKGGSH